MRPPDFWNHKHGRAAAPTLRAILTPASWIYNRITQNRIKATDSYDPGIPVICVGNISMGGTGKTPITAYLLESLTRLGISAAVLSRGYGGREKGPVLVNSKHTAADVGDEPLLLASIGKVWVAAGRDDAARAARSDGAKVLIMDDGHQNPLLAKTLNLIVVDAETGFGNERVFPAGPLREKISVGLSRADAVILMKPSPDFEVDEELMDHIKHLPVIPAQLVAKHAAPDIKLLAFAGIGRPNKFFDHIKNAGGDLAESIGFADHHVYKQNDIEELLDLSREYKAQLVTTEKDFVRLPPTFRQHVVTWPVEVQFEDELTIRRLLHPIIEQARPAHKAT